MCYPLSQAPIKLLLNEYKAINPKGQREQKRASAGKLFEQIIE